MKDLLKRLREIGLEDEDIFALLNSASGSWKHIDDKTIEFSSTITEQETNSLVHLATVRLNKSHRIKELNVGTALASERAQHELASKAERWLNGRVGHMVLLRPMFAHLPLLGSFRWKDHFQIRQVGASVNFGVGLDGQIERLNDRHGGGKYGPPYPFVLEVRVPKSDDFSLGYVRGLKHLTEYESLLSVLLIQHLSTARTLQKKNWTTVWDGQRYNYHLLRGGFDLSEDGVQENFSEKFVKAVPTYGANDYYNHLFIRDNEIVVARNIEELLVAFDNLTLPIRRAFLRASYWFTLGVENRDNYPLSILAFSTSIENLLPRRRTKRCTSCGQSEGNGVTRLFNEHLEKYAPTLAALKGKRGRLYKVRSDLVHGNSLQAIDLDWNSPLRQDDEDALLAEFVARRCLVNWLADSSRYDPTRAADER